MAQLAAAADFIHLHSDIGYDRPTGNSIYLYGCAAVALFILVVACINYVNLATARATRRAHSVGIRKILGASRLSLGMQFLGEAVLFSLAAEVLGLAIALYQSRRREPQGSERVLAVARTTFCSLEQTYNFADSSLPALNLATFLALILITAPV